MWALYEWSWGWIVHGRYEQSTYRNTWSLPYNSLDYNHIRGKPLFGHERYLMFHFSTNRIFAGVYSRPHILLWFHFLSTQYIITEYHVAIIFFPAGGDDVDDFLIVCYDNDLVLHKAFNIGQTISFLYLFHTLPIGLNNIWGIYYCYNSYFDFLSLPG